jgi:hypothetical protein
MITAMQLSGELSKVSFANLLQLVRSGGLTGRINLSQGARVATINIEGGSPVHVEMEGTTGKEALYELFLWQSGSFAFTESEINHSARSISFAPPDESFDKLIKEGLSYADDKYYLDSLGVTHNTVLRSQAATGNYAATIMVNPGLERLDGVRTLADALSSMNWSRREFVHTVAAWISEGLADLAVPVYTSRDNQVSLPDWVVARLRQDNTDLSRAVVDMVIWVDRVKCWMYQADADMDKMVQEIKSGARPVSHMGEARPPSAEFEF